LGSTGLIGAGLATICAGAPVWFASQAAAEEPIKLSVGGFFRSAYMVVIDDNDKGEDFSFIEPGADKNLDGFFSDAEIHFKGRTILDNGLEVGARVELEGESESSEGGDQIDEAWIYFAGGFGEFRIGSEDDALALACILPPGGTANFSAFSPNQWGANAFSPISNSACNGVDDTSDAQKILYISPVFAGFQLTASYTPNPGRETHNDGVGPHLGMPPKFFGEADYNAAVYLTYSHQWRNWGLTWGGGASFEGQIDDVEDVFDTRFNERDFYQTALTVDIGRFSIGGVFEYFNDIEHVDEDFLGTESGNEHDAWVAGGGVAYNYNAWTFGAQYSYRDDDFDSFFDGDHDRQETVQQRAVVTVDYVLGPGINLDAELGYTWRDFDPEDDDAFSSDDDYDGLEIGLGSSLRF
jgi:predicted porin